MGDLHSLRSEHVHFARVNDRRGVLSFQCFRCTRTLSQECYGIVGTQDIDVPGSATDSVVVLHPWCWTCRRQAVGKWVNHPLYTPTMDRYWQRFANQVRAGAHGRKLVMAIDKDDIMGIYFAQDGKCAVTGMAMNWKAKGYSGRNGRALDAPSVDRINSSGNYTLGNIQMVVRAVNVMKNDMSMSTFVELCRRVVAKADQAHCRPSKAA